MSAKHTPGPWKVNATPQSSNQNWVVLDSGANGHSKRVCAVYSDTDEADAHLIAAAPDMLAILEHLDHCGVLAPIAQDMIRAALAKARGDV